MFSLRSAKTNNNAKNKAYYLTYKIKIMTKLKALMTSCLLFIPVASSFAATDTTVINMSTTYTPYVNFTGTAPGSSRFYSNSDIVSFVTPNVANLGTLGLESNISGNCDINFSTINNFRLLHTVTGNNLTPYTIIYQNNNFNSSSSPTLTLPCTTPATSLEFTPSSGSFFTNLFIGLAFIPSGIYQDTIHITVTTQ